MILEILNGHVTPMLGRHGFAKFGKRNPSYQRARDERVEIIDVQGDKYNRKDRGSFTVNVALFFPTLDPIVSAHPVRERPEEYQCPIRVRIGRLDTRGHLLSDAQDLWWEFGPTTDAPTAGAEIAGEIEARALAFFDRLASRQALLDALRTEPLGANAMWTAAIAAWAGQPRMAARLLEYELQQPATRAWHLIQRRQAATVAAAFGLDFPGSAYPAEREVVVTVHLPTDSTEQERKDARWVLHTGLLEAVGERAPDRVLRVWADEHFRIDAALRTPDPDGLVELIRPALERVAALPAGSGHPHWTSTY